MAEESTTPDLVELGSRFLEAANRRDLDTMLGFFAPDAVWETLGLGTIFQGSRVIGGFWNFKLMLVRYSPEVEFEFNPGMQTLGLNGKMSRVRTYLDHGEALRAAEGSE